MPNAVEPSTSTPTTLPPTPDYAAIKTKQQAMWASGDFAVIGTTLQIVGESLCEAVDLRPGARVLDVACGNGNATLAAARRFARVTGLDYVPDLLARAQARAQAEGLKVTLQEGDAENLPFPDGSFDFVLSTFGVMFAPDQDRAARELARVCAPHGKIGLASWTPGGLIGELLRTVGKHVPPPAGLRSPALWGQEEHLQGLFAGLGKLVRVEKRHFNFRYESAAHCVETFRRFYGPTYKAFEALPPEKRRLLEVDMTEVFERHNRAQGFLCAPGEYLEVVIERRA
jgi:ubiquinone/menaquinone biosynthesis C-methylase UbiE